MRKTTTTTTMTTTTDRRRRHLRHRHRRRIDSQLPMLLLVVAASIGGGARADAFAFAPPPQPRTALYLYPGASPFSPCGVDVQRRRRCAAVVPSPGIPSFPPSSSSSRRDILFRVKAVIDEVEEEASSTVASDSPSSLGDIAFLVLPLLSVYVSNQWSRASIYYLVDFSSSSSPETAAITTTTSDLAFRAMNVDLSFDESQYGLLASAAFTFLFAFCSLAAGSLADKYDRKPLTIGGALAWTAATFAMSQAHSYGEVAAARVAMGAACAFCVPAAYSLIAERISEDRAALANSIYGSGVYAGGALASLTVLLDERWGWRNALGAAGAFGIVSALAVGLLLPSDGDRGETTGEGASGTDADGADPPPSSSLADDTLAILSVPRVRWLYLGAFFRFSSGLAIGVWSAPYYRGAFPDDASAYALTNAAIVGGLGLTSGVAGGYLADYLGSKMGGSNDKGGVDVDKSSGGNGNWNKASSGLLVPVVGSLLAAPAWWLTVHSTPSFSAAMAWLALEYLVAECWFGPTVAALQACAGKERAGLAQGWFVLTGALGNLAPSALGWAYGNYASAAASDAGGLSSSASTTSEVLADLLGYGVCAGYVLSSACFLAAAGSSAVAPIDGGGATGEINGKGT